MKNIRISSCFAVAFIVFWCMDLLGARHRPSQEFELRVVDFFPPGEL